MQPCQAQQLTNLRASQAIVIICLTLSILCALARTVIRVRRFRRIYADDIFLFVSLGTYILASGMFWHTMTHIFTEMNIIQGIEPVTGEWLKEEIWIIRMNYTIASMLWLSVYCIKFAFLGN